MVFTGKNTDLINNLIKYMYHFSLSMLQILPTAVVQEKIRKRGIKTYTGLGRYYRERDERGDGIMYRFQLEKGLFTFHIDLDPEVTFPDLLKCPSVLYTDTVFKKIKFLDLVKFETIVPVRHNVFFCLWIAICILTIKLMDFRFMIWPWYDLNYSYWMLYLRR